MKVNIDLTDNIELSAYSKFLSKFKQWVQYEREVKLSCLLNKNKKIKFDIDVTRGMIYGSMEDDPNILDQSLTNVCFIVKELEFIIMNYEVKYLELEISILSTNCGKILQNIIDENIPFQIRQYIVDGYLERFFISQKK